MATERALLLQRIEVLQNSSCERVVSLRHGSQLVVPSPHQPYWGRNSDSPEAAASKDSRKKLHINDAVQDVQSPAMVPQLSLTSSTSCHRQAPSGTSNLPEHSLTTGGTAGTIIAASPVKKTYQNFLLNEPSQDTRCLMSLLE